ncbi:MAG: hypothetical protein K9G49_09305 [Taibaiella sp.]|nr:hypothetical protein [Taibaiella sp.]
MKHYQFSDQIEQDKETETSIAYATTLPGAHTQAQRLNQLQMNLKEVMELYLEEMSTEEISELPSTN